MLEFQASLGKLWGIFYKSWCNDYCNIR